MSTPVCRCNDTGFIPFRGDFRMKDGSVKKLVAQVRRCPAYTAYFAANPLMRDYPGKVPVRREHGVCLAAVRAHEAIYQRSEQKRKDGKEL